MTVFVTNEDIANLIKERTGLIANVNEMTLFEDGINVELSSDPSELQAKVPVAEPVTKDAPVKAKPMAKVKEVPTEAPEEIEEEEVEEEVVAEEEEPVEEAEFPKKPVGGIFGAAAKKKEDAPSEPATKSQITKNIFGGMTKK